MARVVMRRFPLRPTVRARGADLFYVDALEQRLALAVFTVTNALPNGAGSLRQAILDSNSVTGADTIEFSAFFNAPQSISAGNGFPQIGGDLNIIGPGANLLTVRHEPVAATVNGAFNSTATNLRLSGMTVTGGNVNGNGGGLQSTGPGTKVVTLESMVFTGNTASGLGGAIFLNNNTALAIRNTVVTNNIAGSGGGICFFSNGSLVMENCTVANNKSLTTTSGGGAGLYFFGTALSAPPSGFETSALLIRTSTFDHNSSSRAGGAIMVDTFSGLLRIDNSTLSDNTAATSGGAIAGLGGAGSITAFNSTIAGNAAGGTTSTTGGGGVFRSSTVANQLTFGSTILSGNANGGAPDIRVDPFSTVIAIFCAIGNASGFTLAPGSGNNLAYGTNLLLGLLTNNGGPTQTRAILAGSPLIDAGGNIPGATTDQRGPGYPRTTGSTTDIGAFERAIVGPTVSSKQFLFETSPHALRFGFSENVSASLSSNDLELRDRDTGALVTVASWSITYVAATNLATFSVSGLPGNILPDGNYRATLFAAGVTNGSGAPLRASESFDFHVLAGDANRDRAVNFDDLLILAQNYGQTGRTFSQGNFDYDTTGEVDFDDLLLLAQRYGTSLMTATSSASLATTRKRGSNASDVLA